MLDKIKQALGEELVKLVDAKLKESKIELAVMNDGSVVKADKHDKLNLDFQDLQEKHKADLADINVQLGLAVKDSKDVEGLKATIADMTEVNRLATEKAEKDLLGVKKLNAVKLALIAAKANEDDIEMLRTQINTDSLNFDDKNKLIGLDDLVKGVAEKHKRCFGQTKIIGDQPGGGVSTEAVNKWVKAYEEAKTSVDKIKVKQQAYMDGVTI